MSSGEITEFGGWPRPPRWPWTAAVVVLTVALAAAITTAIHYRAAAQGYRVRATIAAGSSGPGLLMLFARTVAIPSSGPLTGEITVFSVLPAHGPAQVMLRGKLAAAARTRGMPLSEMTAGATAALTPGPPESLTRTGTPP
jgi:hypothetical protein